MFHQMTYALKYSFEGTIGLPLHSLLETKLNFLDIFAYQVMSLNTSPARCRRQPAELRNLGLDHILCTICTVKILWNLHLCGLYGPQNSPGLA